MSGVVLTGALLHKDSHVLPYVCPAVTRLYMHSLHSERFSADIAKFMQQRLRMFDYVMARYYYELPYPCFVCPLSN